MVRVSPDFLVIAIGDSPSGWSRVMLGESGARHWMLTGMPCRGNPLDPPLLRPYRVVKFCESDQ